MLKLLRPGTASISRVEKNDPASIHVETLSSLLPEDEAFLAAFTEQQRKTVIRKVDIRLIPILALLYLLAYLDRANIGNAKIEGLVADLRLSGSQYNIALSIFFIPYVILGTPSNLLLLKFARPSTYIGICMALWGITMTLTGVVQNFGGLIACRFLLGAFEAGFFPAAVFIVSRWYLPNETQVRVALFYTSSALAGAFSGLLAFAIAKMDGLAGLAGWRWIFIVEGIATVVAGVATFFILVDSPALSQRWLSQDEIRYLELRHAAVRGSRAESQESISNWRVMKAVLLDWQLYFQALVYWSNTAPNYGLKFTMPQIIKNMGYSSSNAQLLTIPPYVAGAISAYLSALSADRFTWRMPFIVAPQLLVVVSFIILFIKSANISENIGVCYFAIVLACIGFYPINPGGNAWTVENLAGSTKRAAGIAYMLGIGNVGGVIGSYIYIDGQAPRYPTGFGASFGFAALGILSCLVLECGFWAINRQRAKLGEEEIRAAYTDEELAKLGDRSPLFRYTL